MWKALASHFSLATFTTAGIESFLHSFTTNDMFPLVTYPEDPLPQRTAPHRVQVQQVSAASEVISVSMPQLLSRIGLCLQPVSSPSPLDILRDPRFGTLSIVAARDAAPPIVLCSTALTIQPFNPPVHHPASSDALNNYDMILRGNADEVDFKALVDLRAPVLRSIWQISNIELPLKESLLWDRTFGLITREDAQKSRPWSFLTPRDENDERAKRQVAAHDVEFRHQDHPDKAQHGDDLCDGSEAAHPREASDPEEASGKRIASFQSSSEASTRRSSIWDDDYDGEVDGDDASDLTDISEPNDDDYSKLRKCSITFPDASKSSSHLGYPGPEPELLNVPQSNITVLRYPKRRRSSHPALLLLQAENSHLQADQARCQEETARLQNTNTQLVSKIQDLLSQNTSLHASLTTTTKSLATAQDTISTQDLQLHSLRRRVSFLERWVDSLHEEKVALHEENASLREVGSARAQVVEELRESYERLERVVEKAVGASEKRHDCLLEVELEGLRGRLGGLRIVS